MTAGPDIETIEEIPEMIQQTKDQRFGKRVALLTAVYAVLLSICALGGGNAAKEMMMAQQQASNQWAHYQAKAQREHMYRLERNLMEAQLDADAAITPTGRERLERLLASMAAEETRFAHDKEEIADKAREHEAARDKNLQRDPYFDYGEVLLQLAIILASVSIISGSRTLLRFSVAVASLGSFLAFNGFTLLVELPFLG